MRYILRAYRAHASVIYILRKERKMENTKRSYLPAEIEIAKFSSQDIVTASSADSFDYVDDNAWDT